MNTADVVFIIDESGSMQQIKSDAIGGYNRVLEEQKAEPGQCAVTLVLFNTLVTKRYVRVPIDQAQPLDNATYTPSGMTALYDAIGKTLGEARQWEGPANPNHKRICVIITDGAENSSREWNRQSILDLTTELKKDGWEFVYTGANQDAWAVAASMGIANQHTRSFTADAVGTQSNYVAASASVRSLRAGFDANHQSTVDPVQGSTVGTPWPDPTKNPQVRATLVGDTDDQADIKPASPTQTPSYRPPAGGGVQ